MVLNLKTEVFKRSKLPGKYMANILFGWDDDEYLKKLERSWVRWKEKERQVSPEMKS